MSVIKQLAKKEINKGLTNTKQSILIDVFIRSQLCYFCSTALIFNFILLAFPLVFMDFFHI